MNYFLIKTIDRAAKELKELTDPWMVESIRPEIVAGCARISEELKNALEAIEFVEGLGIDVVCMEADDEE
jgi:hypothetical protein